MILSQSTLSSCSLSLSWALWVYSLPMTLEPDFTKKGWKKRKQVSTRPRRLIFGKATSQRRDWVQGEQGRKKGYRSAPHDSQNPPFYPFLICHWTIFFFLFMYMTAAEFFSSNRCCDLMAFSKSFVGILSFLNFAFCRQQRITTG